MRKNFLVILILIMVTTLFISNTVFYAKISVNANQPTTHHELNELEKLPLTEISGVNQISVINDFTLLLNVSDIQNNKIYEVEIDEENNDAFATLLNFYNYDNDLINQIRSLKVFNTHKNNFILQTREDVLIFNGNLENNSQIKTINQYNDNNLTVEFAENSIIINSAADNNNTIYLLALTYTDNEFFILSSNNQNVFEKLTTSNNLSLSNKTILATTINNKLIVNNLNSLYIYDNELSENNLNLISSINLSSHLNENETIEAIETDYFNNIFLLTSNRIIKLSYFQNDISILNELNLNELNAKNISTFALNKKTGDFYLYNNSEYSIYKLKTTTFSTGMQGFNLPVNLDNLNTTNTLVEMATISENTFAYEYPNFIGNRFKLEKNNKIIVLDNGKENFTYVLFNNKNKLKPAYILKDSWNKTNFKEATHKNAKTVRNNVKLFKLPTLLRTENNNFLEIQTIENAGETLILKNTEIIESFDSSKYYTVILNNQTLGYVNIHDITFGDKPAVTPHKPANNKVFNVNGNVNVYKSNNTTSEVIDLLTNFKEVYIENINNSENFTKIIYINQLNQEVEGYILTTDIWIEPETEHNITALVLLGLGVAIAITSIIVFRVINKNKD